MKKSAFYLLAFFASIPFFAQKAENLIQDKFINDIVRLEPYPSSGVVELNAPHFIWQPVLKGKTGNNSYSWSHDYVYKCRIADTKEFKGKNVLESSFQDYTFFIPSQKLKKGTWYWQYASKHKKTGEIKWSAPIAFKITGKEREFLIPSGDDFVKNVPLAHPRYLATPRTIGKMKFTERDKQNFFKVIDKRVGEQLPKTLIYNDRKVLDKKKKTLTPEKYRRYIDKATKEKYSPQKIMAINMIKAYFITGDKKYKEEALRRYYYLKDQYEDIVRQGYLNDFTQGFYYSLVENIFDAFYDDLSEEERNTIVSELTERQRGTYHHFLYHSVLELMSSHRWQHHMRDFFTTSLTLLHHTPEAATWVKYVYQLWTIRAPIGSGDDGGWIAGNGYMGANLESLFIMPYLLTKYSGVDYFEHPWYHNVPSYLYLTAPVGHIAGGFGDNSDTKKTPTIGLIYALDKVKDNAYSKAYLKAYKKEVKSTRQHIIKGSNMFWFQNQKSIVPKGNQGKIPVKQSKVFPDAGIVAMHTDVEDIKNNLMLTFKSSPYGVSGHAHASQNTFNIQYGGEPLFFRTGYYSSWCDHHSIQSYRHTRAQNGILADGIGTGMSSDGYGWIPRFIEGNKISYALGDASMAYDGTIARDEYLEEGAKWKVDFTPENGFGNPGVERFRRHVVMLRPNIIVIYDELEAKQPVNWSWLIHSKDNLTDEGNNVFLTENKYGKGKLSLFTKANTEKTITDQFYSPAVDWLGNGAKKGIEYVNHWHGTVKTTKEKATRFLAVIQVENKEGFTDFTKVNISKDGVYKIGNWTIKAELDSDKEPSLTVENPTENAGVSYGETPLQLNEKTYQHNIQGSTLLVEEKIKEEVIDTKPAAAIYK